MATDMRMVISVYEKHDYVPHERIRDDKLGEVTKDCPPGLPYYVVGEQVAIALDNFVRKGYTLEQLEVRVRFQNAD